jgi:hypothetical protein
MYKIIKNMSYSPRFNHFTILRSISEHLQALGMDSITVIISLNIESILYSSGTKHVYKFSVFNSFHYHI